VVKNDEKNIEALKLLGLCNVNLGSFKEGKKIFETVIKYKNDDATSWFYLANCYDNLDDLIPAKMAYLEVIKLRGNYMDAYKNLGVIYIRDQEPQKALDLSKKALEMVEDDYLFYYMAGTALLALKDFRESIPYLEKAVELNPTHSQLHNNLGTSYLTIGGYDKAYEHYLKSSEADPRNSLTFYNIASILQIQNKLKEACVYFKKAYALEEAEHYLVSLALAEFKSEQYDEAIKHYKLLISQHPEKNNFQYNLACCYEMTGKYTFAIGILSQLVLLNPKSKLMLQKLANLYLRVDQPMNAKEIYERLITQGIVSADIYYEYALICVKTGDMDIAEKILKKVIELNPEEVKARKDLGVIYLEKRLFDYARDEFEKAYEIAPENTEVIFEYATFLHATSDFAKAKELYKKAYEQAPKNLKVIVFNALNSIVLNELDEAKKYAEIGLELAPDYDFVLFVAGKVYYALKDYEAAKFLLIKSWEMNPTQEVENLLALTYFELGEYDAANTIFQFLLEESRVNTTLLINSAKCYEKLGDIKSAKEQLNKALEIFPELEEASEMLARLDKEPIGEN